MRAVRKLTEPERKGSAVREEEFYQSTEGYKDRFRRLRQRVLVGEEEEGGGRRGSRRSLRERDRRSERKERRRFRHGGGKGHGRRREAAGYSVVWGITQGAGGEEVDGAGEEEFYESTEGYKDRFRRLRQRVLVGEGGGRRGSRRSRRERDRRSERKRKEQRRFPHGGGKGDGRRREAAGYSVVWGITQGAGGEEVDGAGEKGIGGQRGRISPKYTRLQRQIPATEATRARRRGRRTARKSTEPERKGSAVREEEEGRKQGAGGEKAEAREVFTRVITFTIEGTG